VYSTVDTSVAATNGIRKPWLSMWKHLNKFKVLHLWLRNVSMFFENLLRWSRILLRWKTPSLFRSSIRLKSQKEAWKQLCATFDVFKAPFVARYACGESLSMRLRHKNRDHRSRCFRYCIFALMRSEWEWHAMPRLHLRLHPERVRISSYTRGRWLPVSLTL